MTELKERLKDRKVLVIGPGKSSVEEKDKIVDFVAKNDVVVFTINYDYDCLKADFIFTSNLRRFRELSEESRARCIVTSNIASDNVYCQVKYRDLLNAEEAVRDNAALMAIRFLMMQGVSEIYLAGIDGYSHDARENYGKDNMVFFTRNTVLDAINGGMQKVLKEFSNEINLGFITTPKYVRC